MMTYTRCSHTKRLAMLCFAEHEYVRCSRFVFVIVARRLLHVLALTMSFRADSRVVDVAVDGTCYHTEDDEHSQHYETDHDCAE